MLKGHEKRRLARLRRRHPGEGNDFFWLFHREAKKWENEMIGTLNQGHHEFCKRKKRSTFSMIFYTPKNMTLQRKIVTFSGSSDESYNLVSGSVYGKNRNQTFKKVH